MTENRHKLYSLRPVREKQVMEYANKAMEALNHYDPEGKYTIKKSNSSNKGIDFTKAEIVKAGKFFPISKNPIFSYLVDMDGKTESYISPQLKNLKNLHKELVNKKIKRKAS